MDCDEYIQRRVKLGYVADAPTSVQLVDSIGNQVFDMLPIVQAGETDTSIELIPETKRIRYYPEEWTRTEGESGCYYDICIPDIAALIRLRDLEDVEDDAPTDGTTIVYNSETELYEAYDITGIVADIYNKIAQLNTRCATIEANISTIQNTLADHNSRLSAIENAIYNWSNDKNTKIPRGNINITSGGYNGDNGIFTRTKNQTNDLDFA